MSRFSDKMEKLFEACKYCWAKEYSDIFPQKAHSEVAEEVLQKYGYPDCTCETRNSTPPSKE